MAMGKTTKNNPLHPYKRTFGFFGALVVLIGAASFYFGGDAIGYMQGATAYSARVACSCRFVADRDMESCATDKLDGMELVTLTDDKATKSVTARYLIFASNTAAYRENYGCVLEGWGD